MVTVVAKALRYLLPLLLLAPLLAARPGLAVEPGDLTLTVTPERPGNTPPYAREMVLLRLRGVYNTQILLEEVRQPALTNFSWTQLGRDTWGRTQMPDGRTALQFERTIAIFPQHTGTFTIEPFTHRLTINDRGERVTVEVRSEPVPFPVAAWLEATGGPDAAEPWWLPARDVTIIDSWDPDPETVELNGTARRIVTLEAQGMLAEGLPPRPVMRTRGIVTFAGPVKRETLITPQGPVARATYQWDIRKGVPEVIPLEAIRIPWFDTVARVMREAEIPARQIGGGLSDQAEEAAQAVPASGLAVAAAGAGAFGLGLALVGAWPARRRLRLSAAARRRLHNAARAGEATPFRVEVARAEREAPQLAALWRGDPEAASGLAALDRRVFGRDETDLDLADLARRLSTPRRGAAKVRTQGGRLAPLDGAP